MRYHLPVPYSTTQAYPDESIVGILALEAGTQMVADFNIRAGQEARVKERACLVSFTNASLARTTMQSGHRVTASVGSGAEASFVMSRLSRQTLPSLCFHSPPSPFSRLRTSPLPPTGQSQAIVSSQRRSLLRRAASGTIKRPPHHQGLAPSVKRSCLRFQHRPIAR